MKSLKIKFFITPVYPYGNDHYYHEMIALAEGFVALGYQVCGNVDYWWQEESHSFLIQSDDSQDFDLGIYDYRYATSFEHLLLRDGFPNLDRDKTHVLVDRNDWISPIWVQSPKFVEAFDLIVAGNLFINQTYPKSVKPWAIGLTSRQMQAIDANRSGVKQSAIAHNFRVGHNLRKLLLDRLASAQLSLPLTQFLTSFTESEFAEWSVQDQKYYQQSTRRHSLDYFDSLNRFEAYLAFGGYYEYKPFAYQPYTLTDKLRRKYYAIKAKGKFESGDPSGEVFVFQYDNFRFWETLYGNTCPISLDANRWSFRFPINPIEGEHYIGIGDWSVAAVEQSMSNLKNAERIGLSGRDWVKENYSPTAQAQRLIDYLNEGFWK